MIAGRERDRPAARPFRRHPNLLLHAGLTAVFIGYLSVWLPHDSAGLSLLGVELGEWIKFLPSVRAGQVAADRNLFYLPPITLGLILALLSVGRSYRAWRPWLLRALAIGVALLAFPAIQVVQLEPRGEWLLRLLWVALVAATAVVAAFLPRFSGRWSLIALLALVGGLAPSWAYFVVRPLVVDLLREPIGVGTGVWLNLGGHLVVAGAALSRRAPSL